jgi:hypothetical protein
MNDLAKLAMDAHGGLDRWRGRQPDGKAVPTPVVVSIDVSDVEFS